MKHALIALLCTLGSILHAQDCIELRYTDQIATVGDTVCMDIFAEGADSIVLFFFSSCFDSEYLQYIGGDKFQELERFGEDEITLVGSVVRVLYTHPELAPSDIDPTVPLVSLCFEIIQEGFGRIEIDECSAQLNLDAEFLDINDSAIEVCANKGYITEPGFCPAEAPKLGRP